MASRRLIPAFLLIPLLPALAVAQWAVNGNPLCTATGVQNTARVAGNGLGGAVAVWQDDRAGSTDIYARQVNPIGGVEWAANGIALCNAAGFQTNPHIAYNGQGYLFCTWEDTRTGTADVYGAIVDRLGNIVTPANGFALCTNAGIQQYTTLAANTSLGIGYAAWTDARGGNNDIYAQAFNVTNQAIWTLGGVALCTQGSAQLFPAIAADTQDGAIVAWQDVRNGNYDIYAQRVGLPGTPLWTANGVGICTNTSPQTNPMIVSDGAGGAIIAWQDQRTGVGIGAIYAQRVNSSGVAQWAAGGVAIAVSTDLIILPRMIPDGSGGAIIAWQDARNTGFTGDDIYAQRVNASGVTQWTANGVAVCTASFAQSSVDVASDGANGAVITWQDLRVLGPADLYAQRLNASGVPQWTANGLPLCTAAGNQFNVSICSDANGAIAAWEDRRTSTSGDIYAQRLDFATGLIGHPQPYISSIVDVPNDEGGFVRITMIPGDGQPSGNEFEVYDVEYHGTDVVWLGTYDGSPSYTFDVLTTTVGSPDHYFVLGDLQSDTVAGTSYDNLAPPAPTLTGQRVGVNVGLSWNSTAADISYWTVQRADAGVLGNVASPAYTDLNVPPAELHYQVRAVDIHGNVGPLSNELVVSAPTGVADLGVAPRGLTVLPASPNPIRESARIRFGMPVAAHVRLELYDPAGRRVAGRDLGAQPAGWHDLAVDGRDDAGRPLSSGVYFCRVTAGSETHTQKLIVRR